MESPHLRRLVLVVGGEAGAIYHRHDETVGHQRQRRDGDEHHELVFGSLERVIPIVRLLISIPAGIACTNLAKFTLLTALGSAVWNTILLMAGYLLGAQWRSILGFLDKFQYAVAAIVVALVVWYVVVKVRAHMVTADE